MWNLKYGTNELFYKTETDRTEGGREWAFGISRCKLVYIEWLNSKVLLYCPGNSTVLCNDLCGKRL